MNRIISIIVFIILALLVFVVLAAFSIINFNHITEFSPKFLTFKKSWCLSILGPEVLPVIKIEIEKFDHPMKEFLPSFKMKKAEKISDWELAKYEDQEGDFIWADSFASTDFKYMGEPLFWHNVEKNELYHEVINEVDHLFNKKKYKDGAKILYYFSKYYEYFKNQPFRRFIIWYNKNLADIKTAKDPDEGLKTKQIQKNAKNVPNVVDQIEVNPTQ